MRSLRDSARFVQALEEVLRRGYSVRFRADGSSMLPAIPGGALITVAPLGPSPVRIGDVVLCRTSRGAIAHRVVRLWQAADRAELILRGDAADRCDQPIALDQVLGRVVAVEAHGWTRALARAMRGAHGARAAFAALTGQRRT